MLKRIEDNKKQIEFLYLEQLVPEDHLVRKIDKAIDFSFIYDEKMFGESGTSASKNIHYYYSCGSKRKKICDCYMKSIQKQKLEDIVINTISNLLSSENNIKFLAKKIYEFHQKQSKENVNLKALEQQRKDVYKSIQNILKAIEQGIITDMTKIRLQDLETELAQIDINIQKEKYKDYSLLKLDAIDNKKASI